MIPADKLKEMIRSYKGDDLASFLADSIAADSRVCSERRHLQSLEQDMLFRHKEEAEKLNARLRKLQSECPHLDDRFYGDASGGNDSCWICGSCGRES